MLKTIDAIVAEAARGAPGVVAIAAAHDDDVLKAAAAARAGKIAEPILIGDESRITELLASIGESASCYRIEHTDSDTAAAALAVRLVASGQADYLMKGLLGTADLMRAVLDKDLGLKPDRLISHVMLYETSKYPKLLVLTDGGMNTFPDLEKKADILENAALVLKALGYENMVAACVCGAEVVNPKIQSTVDADELSKMTERWKPYGMDVIGPVGLDLAISSEACRHKKFTVKGGGEADILLVPTYEVGNGIGKTLSYFGEAKSAGIIVGAKAPIVLVSRSDSAQTKLASIALGAVIARSARRT